MAKGEDTDKKQSDFLDSAKINQENLWKRRQIEWKTSFALWIAMGISTGYIYLYAHRPIPLPWWAVLVIVLFIYSIVVYLQHIHLRAHFISNEKDLDFINYNLNKVRWLNDPKENEKSPIVPFWTEDNPERPLKPDWIKGAEVSKFKNDLRKYNKSVRQNEYYYYSIKSEKMKYHWTPIGITILIATLSVLIFTLMCFESAPMEKNQQTKIESNYNFGK